MTLFIPITLLVEVIMISSPYQDPFFTSGFFYPQI